MRYAATVRFALTDPQGFAANITFDSTTSNRPQPNCGPNPAGVCVPEARDLGGGDLQVLPQLRAAVRRNDLGGRMLRIAYTAIVLDTGLSCTGALELCAPAGKRSTKCAQFSSTGVVRSVLNC